MRRIADYSDDFDRRFREHELSATVAAFFGQQKASSIKLKQIASRWLPKFCVVSFIPKTSAIMIIGKPKVSLSEVNSCENEVIQLLDEITATADDSEESEEEADEETDTSNVGSIQQDRRCVYCKQKSSISTSFFRICGHAYCRCAAQALGTSPNCPLQCQECQSNIHIRDIQIIFSNDEKILLHLLKNSIQNYLIINAQQDDRIFCPNDECDGLIKLSSGYQTCLTCGLSVCSKCQVIDDELHRDRTCTQLIEEKKRREFLPQLSAAAKKFVQENWPVDAAMQPMGRMDENLYLEKEYRSLTRFYKGYEMLSQSLPPDLAKGFFAYHGTANQALGPICESGFDPKRRSGQAYGRGEYFGISAAVSHGYAQRGGARQGFSQMIIAFLLRGPQTSTHGTYCYVVDNPTDWKYAFCLPVLIVTYGPNSASQSSPFPHSIPAYVDDTPCYTAPFRWYWRKDSGEYEPNNDVINQILEQFYDNWKLKGGPSVIITPPVIRYIDDQPQTYEIDFKNNKQKNTKTSYQRPIQRRPMELLPPNQNWYYRDEHGLWIRYEALAQDKIEKVYLSYRSGQGTSTVDVQFPGRPETYTIDFATGKQTNRASNTIRDIKRQ